MTMTIVYRLMLHPTDPPNSRATPHNLSVYMML